MFRNRPERHRSPGASTERDEAREESERNKERKREKRRGRAGVAEMRALSKKECSLSASNARGVFLAVYCVSKEIYPKPPSFQMGGLGLIYPEGI